MDHEYWLSRWRENRTGFHMAGVNPLLERFLPDAAVAAPARVLVPLCGKSVDLAWLEALGYTVVGVDLSEIAAKAFMAEHRREFTMRETPPFKVLESASITINIGNFFEFLPEFAGTFDLIYDRAALIALPPDRRPAYAGQLRSLLKTGGRILLISLEYDPTKMNGPPFTVPEPEVRSIFTGPAVSKLYEENVIEKEPQFRERGLDWMKEVVYRI